MKCIIQVDDAGNPVNHPMTLSNFAAAYPDLDISGDSAPAGFAWFTRKNQDYVLNGQQYTARQKVVASYNKAADGINYEDNFTIVDLSDQEINDIIDQIKANPPERIKSWTLEPDTYFWVPPVAKPEGLYRWVESDSAWVACTTGTNTETDKPTLAKYPTLFTPGDLAQPIFQLILDNQSTTGTTP